MTASSKVFLCVSEIAPPPRHYLGCATVCIHSWSFLILQPWHVLRDNQLNTPRCLQCASRRQVVP